MATAEKTYVGFIYVYLFLTLYLKFGNASHTQNNLSIQSIQSPINIP
jgi:hypothetical protein